MNKMDHLYQARLLVGLLEDFQAGSVSLGSLVDKVEALLNVVGDPLFKDSAFNDYSALEEIYAGTRIGDLDYSKDGKPVVDRAVNNLLTAARAYVKREGTVDE